MKKKQILIAWILFCLAFTILLLCGCDRLVSIRGIRMKEEDAGEIAVGDFSYEGRKVVVEYNGGESREIDLTEEMIPPAERLKFYKVGEQQIKVVYLDRYVTSFHLSVKRHIFEDGYELEGYTVTYDGNPHRVELNRELPEGASIEFEYGNAFVNAGRYEIVGVLSKEGYVSKKLTAELVIEKAEYDLTGLRLDDRTVVYDGSAQTVEASGVPEGVTVSYDVYSGSVRLSGAVSAGEYRIVAHFLSADPNYEKIADREASLVIRKADYDMSAVRFEDHEKTYDGLEYAPAITKDSILPQGVSVSYTVYRDGERVLSDAGAGSYTMVASFRGNQINYNPIPDLTAELTVKRRVIEIDRLVTIDDKTVNYDGTVHSLSLSGQLPQGVTVEFENNDRVYAGEYEVVAHFAAVSENETVDVEEKRAYLIINQISGSVLIDGHEITEANFHYDNMTYQMELIGLDTSTYGIRSLAFYLDGEEESSRIEWGNPDFALEEGKTYRYAITYYYLDEGVDRSVRLSGSSGTYVYRGMHFPDATVTYDGTAHTVSVLNVPSVIEVTYDYYLGDEKVEQAVNAGEYRVVAHFTFRDEPIFEEMEATLTIEKAAYDLSAVAFEGETTVYDGEEHAIFVSGGPVGVSVDYTIYKGDAVVENAVNAGEYRFVAHFIVDERNYLTIPDREATLVIEKRMIAIKEFVTFHKFEVDYDGQEHAAAVEGELPDGVTVSYEGNGKTNAGAYRITAKFSAVDSENEYPEVEALYAILLINRIVFTGEDIVFADREVDFNHEVQKLTVEGTLPYGVEVSYTNNENKYVGVYTVTAHFSTDDPNVTVNAPDRTATLTIRHVEEYVMTNGHRVTSADFVYDREENKLEIKDLDAEMYDYSGEFVYIKVTYPEGRFTRALWYHPKEKSDTKLSSGIRYDYLIYFRFKNEADANSATLLDTGGSFYYDVTTGVFTEVTD